jgi:hypothetical protein
VDAIDEGRCALEYADEWQRNSDKYGAASWAATRAAENLSTILGRVLRWCGETWSTPEEWPSLKNENPRLADAILELGKAILKAQPFVFDGWEKGQSPESWDWRDNLALAIRAIAAIVEADRDLLGCKRDCMEVILKIGYRLNTNDVIRALENAKRIYGKSTIKGALASLVTEGRLSNGRGRGAKGYGPPHWPS